MAKSLFGEASRNYRHGHSCRQTSEYTTWKNIKARCGNPKSTSYARYGGRGVKVCERWRSSFLDFLADMGPKPTLQHSIERIENDGHYEPGNCRWASPEEQANNRRTSRMITYGGETKTLAQWAKSSGVKIGTLHFRLKAGVPIEDALRPIPF